MKKMIICLSLSCAVMFAAVCPKAAAEPMPLSDKAGSVPAAEASGQSVNSETLLLQEIGELFRTQALSAKAQADASSTPSDDEAGQPADTPENSLTTFDGKIVRSKAEALQYVRDFYANLARAGVTPGFIGESFYGRKTTVEDYANLATLSDMKYGADDTRKAQCSASVLAAVYAVGMDSAENINNGTDCVYRPMKSRLYFESSDKWELIYYKEGLKSTDVLQPLDVCYTANWAHAQIFAGNSEWLTVLRNGARQNYAYKVNKENTEHICFIYRYKDWPSEWSDDDFGVE